MLKSAQVCENKIEDMITGLVNQTIENALMKRLNVIVDNTNLKVKYINDIIEKFKYSADIDYRVFDVSLDKAIERDSNRDKKVGGAVINKTGRDEVCREVTADWLELYGIEFDELYMRPKDDYRKDTLIKKEIYQNEVVGKYNLLCVYDDRLQVLDMWYDQGIFTFNEPR